VHFPVRPEKQYILLAVVVIHSIEFIRLLFHTAFFCDIQSRLIGKIYITCAPGKKQDDQKRNQPPFTQSFLLHCMPRPFRAAVSVIHYHAPEINLLSQFTCFETINKEISWAGYMWIIILIEPAPAIIVI